MEQKILYPELSYKINGLCFKTHNDLGSKLKLGFIVNFRDRYLKPKRVINYSYWYDFKR